MILERITEVLRDRKTRMRMSQASYWDERVKSRAGFARSVWHSEAFSTVWNERQTTLLDQVFDQCLGGIRDREVLDVGCGTGRITRHLASRGARATGTDFSAATVDAARAEAEEQGLTARFEIGNIAEPPLPFAPASFDAVISVGCLAVACIDLPSLGRAFSELGRLTKPGGFIVVLEPMHSSRLLGRVLKAPVRAWIEQAESASLYLDKREGMGFVPVRLALSNFDLPGWVVEPAFRAGELLLESLPRALRLADYSLLCLRRGPC